MLEELDLTKKLKRREWRELRLPLQRRLYVLQQAAFMAQMPSVILLEGWAGSGKGAAIRMLTYGLDPRGFQAWAMRRPTEEEERYPWLRRYWLKLPARGNLVLFDAGWYGQLLTDIVERRLREEEAHAAYRDCLDLERMLVDDGHVFVKLWLHISQRDQRRRLRTPIEDTLRWPGSRADDWEQYRKYRQYVTRVEQMLAQTDVDDLRWTLIEATNPLYAQWRVMQTVADALEQGLANMGVRVAAGEDERALEAIEAPQASE